MNMFIMFMYTCACKHRALGPEHVWIHAYTVHTLLKDTH